MSTPGSTDRPRVPGPGLPGRPLAAPSSTALPGDVLGLAGARAADPLELLTPLRKALSRPGPAVVVATSGSTGRPKRTVLTTESLTASGRATERASAGPGQWLMCLPAHYVAGLQVLARSVLAGTVPVVLPPGRFTAHAFAQAAARMSHDVRYVSLVPTQLQRILEPPEGRVHGPAVAALAEFSAVLVGGSALSPRLAERAAGAGIRTVTTYGMSETCGGCVYNGTPLDTVTARLVPDDAAGTAAAFDAPAARGGSEGRIWLGGDVVADGYLDDPGQTRSHFRVIDGVRWYRTDDLGTSTPRGTLRVLGRTDDVINTGGVKVSARVVTATLQEHPAVRRVLVLPVPDREWGQAVAALVIPRNGELSEGTREELSAAVRERHGAAAVPRHWRTAGELPELSTGKPDRRAAGRYFR